MSLYESVGHPIYGGVSQTPPPEKFSQLKHGNLSRNLKFFGFWANSLLRRAPRRQGVMVTWKKLLQAKISWNLLLIGHVGIFKPLDLEYCTIYSDSGMELKILWYVIFFGRTPLGRPRRPRLGGTKMRPTMHAKFMAMDLPKARGLRWVTITMHATYPQIL